MRYKHQQVGLSAAGHLWPTPRSSLHAAEPRVAKRQPKPGPVAARCVPTSHARQDQPARLRLPPCTALARSDFANSQIDSGRGRILDSPVGRYEFFQIKPELMQQGTEWSETQPGIRMEEYARLLGQLPIPTRILSAMNSQWRHVQRYLL